MKKVVYLFALVAFTFMYSNSSAQLVVKKFSITDSKIGGECKLLTSSIDVKGDIASKTFEVDVIESGNYYLNVLQNYYGSKKIKVKVDDSSIGYVESTKKEGLDVYNISDGSNNGGVLKLTKGKHFIKFELEDKLIPQIDYISLSNEAGKSNFELTTIKNEQKELKSKDLKNYNKEDAKNAWIALSKGGPQKTVSIATGFPKNYDYAIDVNYKYTYFSSFYFTSGQQVVLETYNSNCDPVMELVSDDCQYSWMNDDYSGYESRIDVTIPVSGVYYMRVRPYWSNSNGISNVKLNTNIYATNVPIQWTYVNVVNQPSDGVERNYFTAKHNAEDLYSYDTYMWIEDGSSLPGKILARNDDYSGTGDFDWVYTSRIKKSFSSTIRTVWVNAYSQYSQSTCDVYVKASNSNDELIQGNWGYPLQICDLFPNLKADDAIQSAPQDYNYNCISWSGGISDYWEWPCRPLSNFCNLETYDFENWIQTDELSCFDKFYGNQGNDGNPRYSGATNYYRTASDNADVVIDLWGYYIGKYSHGSVRTLANDHPHGYDWESKPGEYMRTFHPREAFNGETYGQILHHYAPESQSSAVKSQTKTLAKSVSLGLSAIDNEKFTESEKQSIKNFKAKSDKLILDTFNEKYTNWKNTWKQPQVTIFSDPNKYAESIEYKEIFEYCKLKGKSTWPLIAEKLNNGDTFSSILLLQLSLKDNIDLLKGVFADNKKKPANDEGAMLVRSPYANSIKYAKKLLAQEKIIESVETVANPIAVTVASKAPANQLQVNMSVENNMVVKIEVFDLTGKVYKLLASNYECIKGSNTYYANISDLNNGIYICKVSGGVDKIVKFIVQK